MCELGSHSELASVLHTLGQTQRTGFRPLTAGHNWGLILLLYQVGQRSTITEGHQGPMARRKTAVPGALTHTGVYHELQREAEPVLWGPPACGRSPVTPLPAALAT